MELRYHRRVQADLNRILEELGSVSEGLPDDFFAEFVGAVGKVLSNPRFFHFDASGLRRCNLDRFPYHFLYDIRRDHIRVWVVRHDRRNPSLGLRRFPR